MTLVVPYPPGGGVDAIGRIVAAKLTTALGQQVVIENHGGAGGVIGMRQVARATPDGYTLVVTTTGMSLPSNLGYDLGKDFTPICLISSTPIVLMSHPDFPAKTVTDIVAMAKKEPGKLTLGTPPSPTVNYFAVEQFKALAKVEATIVSYRGTGPLSNDLVGGHVALGFNTIAPALGNIRAGKIRAIAVAAGKRSSVLPDVPTAAEAGLPGFDAVIYYGMMAPAGMPKPIVDKLNAALRGIVASDEAKNRIAADGGEPLGSSPEEFGANIAREEGKWAKVIKDLHLKVWIEMTAIAVSCPGRGAASIAAPQTRDPAFFTTNLGPGSRAKRRLAGTRGLFALLRSSC